MLPAMEPDVAPENTAVVLFSLAAEQDSLIDLEDFLAVIEVAAAYLEHPRFQKALVKYSSLELVRNIMVDSYTRFDNSAPLYPSPDDDDNGKLLSQMRSSLNQALSNVSAMPEFSAAYPVISPFTASLRRWITSPQLQMQVCACIMLGNLARSDSTCEEFVHTSQVHKPLIKVLEETDDSQLLHAVLGFLKNLALPAKNKIELGNAGLLSALPRLWTLDALPQIQYSSISLTRQLINGCWDNVRRLSIPLSADKNSPAHLRSQLSVLTAIFIRSDAEPIKMEVSRMLTAICRVYNSPGHPIPDIELKRQRFFSMHPDIVSPLSFMVSQKKWPVVRSEGWFVFALMARTPEGAQCISDLMTDVCVFQPLVELLTGKSIASPESTPKTSPGEVIASPPSDASLQSQLQTAASQSQSSTTASSSTVSAEPAEEKMRRIDRENALVLVSELLRTRGNQMALMRRTVFEELLRGGGLLHEDYRNLADSKVDAGTRYNLQLNVREVATQSGGEFFG